MPRFYFVFVELTVPRMSLNSVQVSIKTTLYDLAPGSWVSAAKAGYISVLYLIADRYI